MTIYDALFSAMFNLLSVYINIRVIKLFLPVKITNGFVTLPVYAGVWLCNWVLYYFVNIPNLTTISLFAGLMVIALIIFEGNVGKKVAVVALSMASCIITENVVWKMCDRGILPIKSEPVAGLCAVILEFLIIILIERFVHLDRYTNLPKGSYVNMILLSGGSVILSEIIVLPKHSNNMAMLGLGIICLINVSTYYIYEKIAETYRQKMENAVMQQQVEMYAKQFEVIGKSQEDLKALRHDMKNHIMLIHIYLQNQEYEEASKYAERIEKDAGCKPEIEIDVPGEAFISDFDLNILLGNLLDNAAEALKKLGINT